MHSFARLVVVAVAAAAQSSSRGGRHRRRASALLKRGAFAATTDKVSLARRVLDHATRGAQLRPDPHGGPSLSSSTRLFVPTAFGGDPSGATDSTNALIAARDASMKAFGEPMAEGIVSLGGAGVDLAGGAYLTSAPLTWPGLVGDVTALTGGTLTASSTFPRGNYVVEIGDADCDAGVQGSCNEFVSLTSIFIDAGRVAAGCVRIIDTMGATVTDAFFVGFVEAGLRVDGGHETLLSDAWLAEVYWDDDPPGNSSSVGVLLDGNDHSLDNVVLFDYATVGVVVNNPAAVLSNVHSWNGGGVGIRLNADQARLEHCYLDYDTLEIAVCDQVVVQDTFFLATYAAITGDAATACSGLRMRHNTFAGLDGPSVRVVESNPSTSRVVDSSTKIADDVVIEDDAGDHVVSTTVRKAVDLAPYRAVPVALDFADDLAFPEIDYVQITGLANDTHACLSPADTGWSIVNGTTLLFENPSLLDGCTTLFVEVRQGL